MSIQYQVLNIYFFLIRIRKQTKVQNKIIVRGLFQMQLATSNVILFNQVWHLWNVDWQHSEDTLHHSEGTIHTYFLGETVEFGTGAFLLFSFLAILRT